MGFKSSKRPWPRQTREQRTLSERRHRIPAIGSDAVKDQLEALINQMIERGIMFSEAIGEFEKKFIKGMLEKNKGNQSRAAQALGIHRNTLSRKISELGLDHQPKLRKRSRRPTNS